MEDAERTEAVDLLAQMADRLDALAETAALMDDEAGAVRLRNHAARRRAEAMRLLDDRAPG